MTMTLSSWLLLILSFKFSELLPLPLLCIQCCSGETHHKLRNTILSFYLAFCVLPELHIWIVFIASFIWIAGDDK